MKGGSIVYNACCLNQLLNRNQGTLNRTSSSSEREGAAARMRANTAGNRIVSGRSASSSRGTIAVVVT